MKQTTYLTFYPLDKTEKKALSASMKQTEAPAAAPKKKSYKTIAAAVGAVILFGGGLTAGILLSQKENDTTSSSKAEESSGADSAESSTPDYWEWRRAMEDLLETLRKTNASEPGYQSIDMDGDTIPELFYSPYSDTYKEMTMYYFNGTEYAPVTVEADFMVVSEVCPKEQLLSGTYAAADRGFYDYFRYEAGKVTLQRRFCSTSYGEYFVDDTSVTQAAFDELLAPYEEMTFSSLGKWTALQ